MLEEEMTRWTIDLALIDYVLALIVGLRSAGVPCESTRISRDENVARGLWTAGCLLLWLHILLVFHFYHDWSHTNAVEHTAQETAAIVGIKFGSGVWFNYVFAAVWTADMVWWHLSPLSYRHRSPWISGLIHFYLAFIIFNATVVFKTGPLRWAGIIATVLLAMLWIRKILLARVARNPASVTMAPEKQ